jgi:tRNA threonylcarbamoyladenosine biosynthesis protein TsaE
MHIDYLNKIMNNTTITVSPEETEKFGYEFAKQITVGTIICLYGDLGAGKTTFTKGFAKGLGIHTRIISPTFSLVRQYNFANNIFYHLDLYRLESEDEIKGIGIQDMLSDENAVVLIEWADKLGSLLPEKRIDIIIKIDDISRNILVEEKNVIT